MEATSGLMTGGEESFYRWCVLRKGRSFELRQDSAKLPRTNQAVCAVPLPNSRAVHLQQKHINDTSSLSFRRKHCSLASSTIGAPACQPSILPVPAAGYFSQVVFLWVLPKTILGLSCDIRFFIRSTAMVPAVAVAAVCGPM
jgi:hypothetical protein